MDPFGKISYLQLYGKAGSAKDFSKQGRVLSSHTVVFHEQNCYTWKWKVNTF